MNYCNFHVDVGGKHHLIPYNPLQALVYFIYLYFTKLPCLICILYTDYMITLWYTVYARYMNMASMNGDTEVQALRHAELGVPEQMAVDGWWSLTMMISCKNKELLKCIKVKWLDVQNDVVV